MVNACGTSCQHNGCNSSSAFEQHLICFQSWPVSLAKFLGFHHHILNMNSVETMFACQCGRFRFVYYEGAKTDFVTLVFSGNTFRNVPGVSETDFVAFLFAENTLCDSSRKQISNVSFVHRKHVLQRFWFH